MKAIIEGLLFVSGDEGITLENIKSILEIDEAQAKSLLKELFEEYQKEEHGISIEYIAGHYKMTTKHQHKDYYQKLIKDEQNKNLSDSALEVLSIIAYNEPISRISIDEIRGVNSAYIVRRLLLLELIEEKGKSNTPGRPMLYGVTQRFLDYFGLGSISELPELQATEQNIDNESIFDTKYHENN